MIQLILILLNQKLQNGLNRFKRPYLSPTYRDGREIAGLMCGAMTFWVPPQYQVNAGLVILRKYSLVKFTLIKSRAITLSRSPQCRAFSRAVMDEKSSSPLMGGSGYKWLVHNINININLEQMSQLMGLWYLSHRRPAGLRRACVSAQSRQSLRCLHTWSMEADERVRPKIRHLAPLDGCLKNEFKEDEKCHNLMSWFKSFFIYDLITIFTVITSLSWSYVLFCNFSTFKTYSWFCLLFHFGIIIP